MKAKFLKTSLIVSLLLTCSIAFSQTEVHVYSMAEIDSVRIHYFPIPLYIKRGTQMDTISQTPLYRLVSRWKKEWSETPVLSWDDFIPVDSREIGSNSVICITTRVSSDFLKYGNNTDYTYENLTVAMDPSRSYYDPNKADEWDLRYNKILFDLAELSAREAVRTCNRSQDTAGDIKDCYEELFEERKQEFFSKSLQGKDTAVIRDYEVSISRELKNNTRNFTPQEFGYTPTKRTWLEKGAHLGYTNKRIIGNGLEYLGPANGYTIGIEIGSRGLVLQGEFYALMYGKLRESGFYYDTYNDYNWSKEKEVNEAGIRLKAGYTVFSNEYIRITPVVGTSFGSLTQYTDNKQNNSNHYIESKLPGNQDLLFGIDTDWIMWRDHYPDGISFSGLRFSTYGIYHRYKEIGDVWSLNLGISFIIGH